MSHCLAVAVLYCCCAVAVLCCSCVVVLLLYCAAVVLLCCCAVVQLCDCYVEAVFEVRRGKERGREYKEENIRKVYKEKKKVNIILLS